MCNPPPVVTDKMLPLLKCLGFNSFNEYLSSDVWKKVSQAHLAKRPRCFVCNSPATHVKHLCYRKRDLLGWKRAKLISMCKRCHRGVDLHGNGELIHSDLKRRLGHLKAEVRRRRELGMQPNDWLPSSTPPPVHRSPGKNWRPKVEITQPSVHPPMRSREEWVELEAKFNKSVGKMFAEDKVTPAHLVPEHLRSKRNP